MSTNLTDAFEVESLAVDGYFIVTGDADPSTGVGITAPVGSIYLRNDGSNNGKAYVKHGISDTNWTDLAATSITMNTSRLLGRTTAGVGAAEEITVGSGLTLIGGVLSNVGAAVVKRIWQGSVTSTYGTSDIIPGSSPPPISGTNSGTQIWSQTITPNTTSDKYTISVALSVSCGTANATVTIALFRNNTYIGSAIELDAGTLRTHQIAFIIPDEPATTSAVTYSMRIGSSSGTWYVNRRAAENTYGGAKSGWSILES